MRKLLKKTYGYLIVIIIQILILFFNYKDVNISYPMAYEGGDEMGVYYYAKMFDEFGISLQNPMTGGVEGANMYDYPYTDSLSFSIVKIIGLFSDNPFWIINIFYFLCSILIAMTSYYVLNKRNINISISITLALLFANSIFYQTRYGHMWLVPYFMLPLACDIALDILDDNILKKDVKLFKNPIFIKSIIISFLCAFTGLYYAFFACVLFAAALVIRFIQTKKIRGNLYSICFIFATAFGCLIQIIPNIIYHHKYGANSNGDLAIRNIGDAEEYGLKFVQLLLPRPFHRIGFLSELSEKYRGAYPLVNENITASLGLVASIGFIIALVWLFSKKEKKSESYLIVATFMVATIGGIGSLFSLLIHTPMRCYNRMSLVIMFLSLLCFGKCLQEVLKKIYKQAIPFICLVILVIGIYDQTIPVKAIDTTIIDCQKTFIETIENELDDNSLVFELPYVNWPSGGHYGMFSGYLFSENLRWSYGAMQGRKEALWQQKVAYEGTGEMINDIVEMGYKGIYVDVNVYEAVNGAGSFQDLYVEIMQVIDVQPLVSSNGMLYFWNLNDYIEQKNIEEIPDAA